MLACLDEADEALDDGFYYHCSGSAHCPLCYGCPAPGTGSYLYLLQVHETQIAPAEAAVEALGEALVCDDGASADGLTDAERSCRRGVALGFAAYVKKRGLCLQRCRNKEARGKLPSGACTPPAPADAATVACVGRATAALARRFARCVDAPECLAPPETLQASLDASLDESDGRAYCAMPSPCHDLGSEPTCDGACPAGTACIAVTGRGARACC
jgi:hypothetical protein